MTDEKRDLGRVAYEVSLPRFRSWGLECAPFDALCEENRTMWHEAAEVVAAIAREEGYREGLERAAQWHKEYADMCYRLNFDGTYTDDIYRHEALAERIRELKEEIPEGNIANEASKKR